jgi:hypothetical protein
MFGPACLTGISHISGWLLISSSSSSSTAWSYSPLLVVRMIFDIALKKKLYLTPKDCIKCLNIKTSSDLKHANNANNKPCKNDSTLKEILLWLRRSARPNKYTFANDMFLLKGCVM